MASRASTMSELIEDFRKSLDHDKDDILDSSYPEDRLHEEADSAVPIYNSDLAELLADDQSLATIDDPGLVSEDADIWKRIQVAIYERLIQEAYEWLQEAKDERKEAESGAEDEKIDALRAQGASHRVAYHAHLYDEPLIKLDRRGPITLWRIGDDEDDLWIDYADDRPAIKKSEPGFERALEELRSWKTDEDMERRRRTSPTRVHPGTPRHVRDRVLRERGEAPVRKPARKPIKSARKPPRKR